uniref:Uncharacterized protein n=1 Tax=Romanomermis culicivorax TaxID=13658 RepID=A0A915I9L0_ROMCU
MRITYKHDFGIWLRGSTPFKILPTANKVPITFWKVLDCSNSSMANFKFINGSATSFSVDA